MELGTEKQVCIDWNREHIFTGTNYSMIEYCPLSSLTWKSTEKTEGWWLLWCLCECGTCGTELWNLWASWDMRYPKFHVGVGSNQAKTQKRRGIVRERNTQQMKHTCFYSHVLEETREWISDFQMLVGTDFGAKKDQAMSTFVRLRKRSKNLTEMTVSFQWQWEKPRDGGRSWDTSQEFIHNPQVQPAVHMLSKERVMVTAHSDLLSFSLLASTLTWKPLTLTVQDLDTQSMSHLKSFKQ